MPPPPLPYRHSTMPPSFPTQIGTSSLPMHPQTSAPGSSSADLAIDPTLNTRRHRSEAPFQYHEPAEHSLAGLYSVAPYSPWNNSMGIPSASANGMDASYVPYSAGPTFAGPHLSASDVGTEQSTGVPGRHLPDTSVNCCGPSPSPYAYPVSAPPVTGWNGAPQTVFAMSDLAMAAGPQLPPISISTMGPAPASGTSGAHKA